MGIEDIEVLTRPDDPQTEDENRVSHIVGPKYSDKGKIQGRSRIMMAMIEGLPIEALCGYIWVPTRDPDNYPICQACLAIANRKGD